MRRTNQCPVCLALVMLIAATLVSPIAAEEPPQGAADRKDGLSMVHSRPVQDGPSKDLLAELQSAREAGDVARVQALHEELGWTARACAPWHNGDQLCQRVVRGELRDPPRRWEADVLVTNQEWSSACPAMTSESNGRLWVAVDDLNGNYIDIYFSDDDGVSWIYYLSLYATAEDLTNPSIVVGEGYAKRLMVAYEYAAVTSDAAIHVYWENLYTHVNSTEVIEAGQLVRYPQICVDSPETNYWYPYVTYIRGTIGDRDDYSTVLFTRSFDYGETWQAPATLATQTARDHRPDIDFGGHELYAVYTRTYVPGDRDTYVRRSTNYGATWDAEIPLGYSTYDECNPRVAATNGGNAVVVAYSRWWSPSEAEIDDYYSNDAGDIWHFGSFPDVPGGGVSGGIDLCASYEYGSIHTAFVNGANVYYTRADYADPSSWSPLEIVNDTQTAEGDEWVAVAANPRREIDECVAWADHRSGANQWVFFDSGYPLGDYVIIDGANNLADELAPLIEWKESLGYAVKYVTRNEIFSAYPTGDNAERIWYYLRDRWIETRYVLLVGTIAQIPMRILYPDGDPGNAKGYGSDYYYAKLNTNEWDLDNDNRWGEFYQDALDFFPDALVGRIPYGDGPHVAAIAQNIVAYEQDTGAWKRRVLLAHGIANNTEQTRPKTDMAWAGAHIQLDFLEPYGWSWDTLYEHGGTNASIYTSTADLSQANFEVYGGLQQQGVINCMAHGATNIMTSYPWTADINNNGYVDIGVEYGRNTYAQRWRIPQDPVSALVFLAGCHTGVLFGTDSAFAISPLRSRYLFTIQHDATALLAFLENGAPAVIGASAGADYEPAWQHPTQGDVQSLNYYFYYFLVAEGMRAGDAFHAAMLYFVGAHPPPQRGIRDFNYFGDPALEVAGIANRRWRSNDFASSVLPSEGRLFAQGTPPVTSGHYRDEDPTVWWPSGEIEASKSVEALLQAADGSIYAGANVNSGGSGWEGTVQRSIDGGETWNQMGDLADCKTVSSLIQTGSGSLIAGGLAHFGGQWQGVIYRSTNGGASWSRVLGFPGGMVLDLTKDGDGNLWAACGWDGAIYCSLNDGASWVLQSWLGYDTYVYSIEETSAGRLFITLGGPAVGAKVMWSENGGAWFPASGISSPLQAYDLIESGGMLYAGVATSGGGAIYSADLSGEVWSLTPALPDGQILAIRCLCTGPAGMILAGAETEPGISYTDVLAWDAEYGAWYSFGGAIDAAGHVHALCATPEMLYAGTGNQDGRIYQHILPTSSSVTDQEEPAVSAGLQFALTNPAWESVELRYTLPEPALLTVEIYDAAGRLLRILARESAAGSQVLLWDGNDHAGSRVPTGVYTYRLLAGKAHATGRVVLLR